MLFHSTLGVWAAHGSSIGQPQVLRSATTLRIVRAGGIGQTLYESIRSFQYAETAAQIIIVVVTVVAIDLLSARIRRTLV
jgi:phosphonate transport system permease protein